MNCFEKAISHWDVRIHKVNEDDKTSSAEKENVEHWFRKKERQAAYMDFYTWKFQGLKHTVSEPETHGFKAWNTQFQGLEHLLEPEASVFATIRCNQIADIIWNFEGAGQGNPDMECEPCTLKGFTVTLCDSMHVNPWTLHDENPL